MVFGLKEANLEHETEIGFSICFFRSLQHHFIKCTRLKKTLCSIKSSRKMNSNSSNEEHQNFEHNIKKEPEEEFLCILPKFDSGNSYEEALVQVKQEKEVQSEGILKLQCKICKKIFRSIQNMKSHEKNHQNQQCKVCNRKVPPQSFEKHMKRHQNERSERKLECKICFQKFLTKSQLYHHVLNHSRRFYCDLCGLYSAASKHVLMVHLTLHLVQGRYKCIFCQRLFDDRESFRLYSRQAHRDPKNRIGLSKADLSCGTCGKELSAVQKRKQHERSHKEKVQCPICEMKVNQNYLAVHLKRHELKKKEKKIICDICTKSFITKESLVKHKRIHNKFKCDICGYENTYKELLKDHLEVHVSLVKTKCNICRKSFTSTKAMKYHLKIIHNLNVDPSELCCNICQVKCRNLQALKSHKTNHNFPKTCKICSQLIKPRSLNF